MLRRLSTVLSTVLAVLCVAAVAPYECIHSVSMPAGAVDRITVLSGGETVATVTDAGQIQKVEAFFRARKWGWYKTWHTFPAARYTVRCESAGKRQFVVWIGHDGSTWMGFRKHGKDAGDNLLRTISSAERAELLRMLGL